MWKRALVVSALLLACIRQEEPGAPTGEAPEGPPVVAPGGRLPEGVWPTAYALQLEIAPEKSEFRGHASIEVQLERSLSSILLHARAMQLRRVSVQALDTGEARPAQVRALSGSDLTALELAEPIGPGRARIEIDYTGEFDTHLDGLHKLVSEGRAYAFTQFEPISARHAFPCFDEPRFKTPFDITLRVPVGLTAISNTRAQSQTEVAAGQLEVKFARTEPLPTYLIAFAVGPLDVVDAPPLAATTIRPQALPLRGVAARGHGSELGFALRETPALLESLERYFGVAYPYDKLDLIAVPDFASGAMENAGAITFRDTLLLLRDNAPEGQRRASVSVNAHELAHQWFGNLVTMPWWDDIWLNEGFATWLSGRVLEDVHPEYQTNLTRVATLERAFETDGWQSARRVRQAIESDHDIRNAFDAITYTKGAALLAMFERYLGAVTFRAGLRAYLERHRFSIGTSRELLAALERSSGKPVASAFESFLNQPGAPSLSVELECPPGAPPSVRLRQRRSAPLGSGIDPAAHWQVPVCLHHDSGASEGAAGPQSTEHCSLLEAPEASVQLNQKTCPRWVFPNSHATGYYRWTLGDAEWTALLEQGYTALDAAERLSLLTNTDASLRAGGQPLEALMAVVKKVGKEPERQLLSTALDVLGHLRRDLLGAPELPAYRRLVQELAAQRQERLGLFPAAKESGDAKLLRPVLVSALAFEARDPSLRKELALLGQAHLGMTQDARLARLPSEVLDAALGVAVQEGGKPVLERAMLALKVSNDGTERRRLLSALGANQNPELSPLVLELSLAEQLRTNERLAPIIGQAWQLETREVTYLWVERHFDALVARLGQHLGTQVTRVAGAFCTQAEAERARQFFTPRVDVLLGGPRLLRLNLEATETCAAFAQARRPSAQKYFASGS